MKLRMILEDDYRYEDCILFFRFPTALTGAMNSILERRQGGAPGFFEATLIQALETWVKSPEQSPSMAVKWWRAALVDDPPYDSTLHTLRIPVALVRAMDSILLRYREGGPRCRAEAMVQALEDWVELRNPDFSEVEKVA